MDRSIIPYEWAARIWRVLVEECGCRDDSQEENSFCRYLSCKVDFGHEWRFIGALGFGGKFYNDHFSWRTGYYRGDDTDERRVMVNKANERLAALRAEYRKFTNKALP